MTSARERLNLAVPFLEEKRCSHQCGAQTDSGFTKGPYIYSGGASSLGGYYAACA